MPCKKGPGVARSDGYHVQYHLGKRWAYHRLVAHWAFGPCPDGMEVCHSCDNRWCCEPTHLRYDTRSNNLHDIKKNGRVYRKLSQPLADAIRREASTGRRQQDIAKDYGVSQTQVSLIHRKAQWV